MNQDLDNGNVNDNIINEPVISGDNASNFNDYIDYVITYYGITKNEEYNYIILTEMQTGDNNYYANLRMR